MAVPEIPDSFYDLVLRYFDGDLDAAELDELNELLRSDGRLRAAFAALCDRTRMVREIGEPQRQAETRAADGSEGVITQLKLAREESRGRGRGGMARRVRAFASLAALALVSVGLFLGFSGETTDLPVDDRVSGPVAGKNHIARLVQVVKARWGAENADLKKGARLSQGKIRLESGLAKLRFSSGAKITLEGPAEYEIVDDDLTRLVSGRLSAKIPRSAIGFKVDTPTARVVDLGTAFGVDVEEDGATEVAVFEGEVEVELPENNPSEKGKRLITQGNSVRTEAGTEEIRDARYDVSKFERSWPVTAGIVQTVGMVKFLSLIHI